MQATGGGGGERGEGAAVLHRQSPSTLHGHQPWDVGGLHGEQSASVAASAWFALWTQVKGAEQSGAEQVVADAEGATRRRV